MVNSSFLLVKAPCFLIVLHYCSSIFAKSSCFVTFDIGEIGTILLVKSMLLLDCLGHSVRSSKRLPGICFGNFWIPQVRSGKSLPPWLHSPLGPGEIRSSHQIPLHQHKTIIFLWFFSIVCCMFTQGSRWNHRGTARAWHRPGTRPRRRWRCRPRCLRRRPRPDLWRLAAAAAGCGEVMGI